MSRTPDQTISDLKRIGVPQILFSIAGGIRVEGLFEWELQEPKTFYYLITDFPDNMPFEKDLIPLWETNGDKIIAYVDREEPFVIEYYFEDKANEYKVIGQTVLKAIEGLLERFYEDVEDEAEADEVLKAARQCGHPDAEGFIENLSKKQDN